MPSIVDRVVAWYGPPCDDCGAPIDLLQPAGFEAGPRRTNLQLPMGGRCSTCQLRSDGTADQRLYQRLHIDRFLRDEIGLDPVITLLRLKIEPPNPPGWGDGYRAEAFAVVGFGADTLEGEQPSDVPPYHLWPPTPNGFPGFALVLVGARIRHEAVAGAYLRLWSNWRNPTAPPRLEVIGWQTDGLSPDDWSRLWDGRKLWMAIPDTLRGRPRKSFARSRREWVQEFRMLANEMQRRPTQDEFLRRMRTDRRTLRENLTAHNLWPWEKFVSAASSARTVVR